jgi:hypothetical protein
VFIGTPVSGKRSEARLTDHGHTRGAGTVPRMRAGWGQHPG